MAIPHRRFVMFLLSRGLEGESLKTRLDDLELPEPTTEELASLMNQMSKSLPPAVQEQCEKGGLRLDHNFIKWMSVLEVDDAWRGMNRGSGTYLEFKRIKDLMEEPRIRITIEALLLQRQESKDIARIISQKYLFPIGSTHVDLFQRYFFDVPSLQRKDWRTYIGRVEAHQRHIYFMALTESLATLKGELELPTDVSVASDLSYFLNKISAKTRIYLSDTSPESNKEARNWLGAYTKVVDKYEKYRSKDAADLAQSLQLEFDIVNTTYEEADEEVAKDMRRKSAARVESEDEDESKQTGSK